MKNRQRSLLYLSLGIVPALLSVSGAGLSPASGPRQITFGSETDLSALRRGFDLETTIAANPANPRNLVAGWFGRREPFPRDCQFAATFNGGQSWSLAAGAPRQPDHSACIDPSLVADANGTFYYSYLETIGANPPGIDRIDLVVAKSTDGGATFPTFSLPSPHQDFDNADKPYLGVDTGAASPFKGTIYLGYTAIEQNTFIAVQVSHDGGTTWSPRIVLSRRSADLQELLFDALPVVAPDGTAYVFYMDGKIQGGRTSIEFVKSTDGGRTWSQAKDVAANLPSPGFFHLRSTGANFGQDPDSGINASSYPSAAIAPDGTLYVVWTDFPNGSCVPLAPQEIGVPACENADVRLAVSHDGGSTWSAPVKVSDETNATDQFFPWVGVHPDGLLSIAWTDRRLDPGNINYDVFYTNTADGRRFLPNVRVTSQTSLLDDGDLADYNGLAAAGDLVFPVWTDLRTGADSDIFTARGVLK